MFKKQTILLLIATWTLIFGAASCKKDKNKTAAGFATFPLSVSNTWQYFTESQNGTYYSSFVSNWRVIIDTSINGFAVTKISQRDSNLASGYARQGYSYYSNKSDGLYGVAVENSGSSFMFKNNEWDENMEAQLFGSFGRSGNSSDSLFIPDTALYLLRYPVIVNDQWTSNEFGPASGVKRKWLGDETIATSAGTFNCKKLQIIFDLNHNNFPDTNEASVYQYFSDKGLIQEEKFQTFISFSGDTTYLHRVTKLTSVNF